MEPDRKTLEIEVTAEHGERNSIFFTTLELPAIRGQIQDALQRLRTADQPEQHLDVSIRRCPLLPELIGIPLEAPTLWELNFFAKRLASMTDEDTLILKGVFRHRMELGLYQNEIQAKELINLTYGLDTIMVASSVGNDKSLGRFVAVNELNEDVNAIPTDSLYLLDLAKIGQLQRKNEGGMFVDGCYVAAGEYELAQVYDGTHLPETEEETEDIVFRLLVAQAPTYDPEETCEDAEWINLPISPEKAEQIAHNQKERCIEDCVYYDMESAIPQIGDQIFVSMNQFSLLNQIAMQYQVMADPEQMKYKAALEAEPYLNLEKALDIALHLPDYELSYLSKDADDFFKEYLSHHLKAGFDRAWLENIVPHPDSQMLLSRLGAVQTYYGIISARGQSLYRPVSYEESPVKALSSQALTDEKLEVVEVLGQTALFTSGRVTEQEVPERLYRYDLREGETLSFSSIENHVLVNHGGTVLTKAPLDFGGQEYLVFDEDTCPNFLGYSLTPDEFLQTDFTETDEEQEAPISQTGGIQL